MGESEKMTSNSEKQSSDYYEKLYTMLLQTIPSSVLLIDRSMRVTAANQNFLIKSRRFPSDTIGKKLEEVFPSVILEQLRILDNVRQVFATAQATQEQRMYYRAPGVTLRCYYYRLLPVAWQGQVDNIILLMDDITDQVELGQEMQQLQSHLALVVESTSEIVASTDPTGKIISWNSAAENLTGHTFHEVKGRKFADYLNPELRVEVQQKIEAAYKKTGSQMIECPLTDKQGGMIDIFWSFSSMQTESAQPVGIVAVGRDLSQQRIFEQQLLRSEKLASLGVMAGGVAHEIRNPLAVCSSAAQFLIDDSVSADFKKDCVIKIHNHIRKAASIIENLLNFANPGPKGDGKTVSINFLLADVLNLVGNQAKIKKIKLVADIPETPALVHGNAGLLQQVFINLFLNSIKAMPDGGLLQLILETIQHEAVVTLTDTGCGISESNLDKIFDPFFTTAPVGEGTGLGLSVCHSIVKQHKGAISVDSVEGKGTKVTVRLPVISDGS